MNLSEAIDLQVFHTMRMATIQEVIDMAMMENPPKNEAEYRLAMMYIMETISGCQPDAFKDVSDAKRFVVIPNCKLSSIELVDRWPRLALLALAIGDYDTVGFFLMGALETAMQFRNDELLLLAAKLSFPVGARANHVRDYVQKFLPVCIGCAQTILAQNQNYQGTGREQLILQCITYYRLLGSISEYITTGAEGSKVVALSCAVNIDQLSNKRLDLQTWTINELVFAR